MGHPFKYFRVFIFFNVCASFVLFSGCARPYEEEGSIPHIQFYLDALVTQVDDPDSLLSTQAQAFIQSTYFLFVYEKSVQNPYLIGFDYAPVCREFLKSNHPVAKSSTAVRLTKQERSLRPKLYGYIPVESWSDPETGLPVSVLPGKGLLLCSTTEMPSTDQSQVFGTPTWLSKLSPNIQPLFLDEL